MKKIRFELKIEKSYKGSYPLEEVLECFGLTEEEWNGLDQEQQESLICDYLEDEINDIDTYHYHSMDYHIKIQEQ